jgi:hypothetical protein
MFLFENGPESGREIDAFFRDIAGPDETDRFWRDWRDRYITEHDIAALAQSRGPDRRHRLPPPRTPNSNPSAASSNPNPLAPPTNPPA